MAAIKEKIGCALIGVRGYGAVLGAKIKESGCFDLRWCCHHDAKVADQAAAQLGGKGTNQVDKIWTDKKVAAVFIIVPNHLHFSFLKQALKAGKHVFVEKPMTETLQEADEIKALLKGKKQIFMVGHNYRRKSGIRKIKDMLEQGKLGKPVSFEMVNSHGGAFNFPSGSWRSQRKTCRGGPLTMLGTHSFDTAEYLFGPAKNLFSIVERHCSPIEAPDTSTSVLQMENGTVCYFSNHYNVPSCAYAQVHGSEGSIHYVLDSQELSYRPGRDVKGVALATKKILLKKVDDRLEQVKEFAAAIGTGAAVETGFKQGYRAVAFVEKAMESSSQHAVVNFKTRSL